MNGMPGTWTPSQPVTHFEFEDPNSAYLNNPAAGWPEAELGTTNPQSMRYYPRTEQQSRRAAMQAEPMYAPNAGSENSDLRGYRTQVQLMSEQILQMKNAQESLELSQSSMQQLHEREMLELKLQQTTTDRDRLKREHELESFNSLSEIINDVVPSPTVPNAGRGQVPRSKTQSGQVRSMPPQNLPTVDESL
jgi:hypothetical protein